MLKSLTTAGALTLAVASLPAAATIVEFETVLGNIQVNLYDESTPETVENFLAYVEAGSYDGSFIHRSIPNFIVQGGGFAYDQEEKKSVKIDTESAVANEPEWSNRKGTIAMAKVGDNPNSATSQWFFNLDNNHTNLDVQNGGFTVFGEVISGMDIVEDIADLPRFNLGGAYTSLPLRNYGEEEIEDEQSISPDNLVSILSITVIDDSENSAADLEPVPNTLIDEVGQGGGGDSSSSGALGLPWILALMGLGIARRFRRAR
ncbi:peptidylprolyl isomerase [Marinimicrobium agarilyticum]|uniref:peptidylprolyl isomerase n=1 Tax=Marinimicrobium agarilyticum TaxID=306546 RepID=UPI00041AC442|nr:peptidylprolyl isomerase [Marinimicrobium agarilyticum]